MGWQGNLRPEHEYEDLDAFYARLHASAQLPTTSQPSVGDFLACYRPLLEGGRDVASVHLASGLSGTCDSAREAAKLAGEEGFPGRVEVLDSQTGAGGLGCMALVAADAARHGGDTRGGDRRDRRRARAASTSGSASTRSSTCAAAGASARRRRWSGAP